MSGADPGARTPRWRALGAAAALLAGLGLPLAVAPAASAQTATPNPTTSPRAGNVLPQGALASSRNMRLVANLPKTGAFASEDAFNSDLAFQGNYAYQGNYNGFRVWDISNPEAPTTVAEVLCPGSQNDVSVTGDLLFLSTDSRRSNDSCSNTSTTDPASYWEGMKIFDISDPASPKYVKSVETDCGSHTHTLVPGTTPDTAYIYVSSYDVSTVAVDCQAPHDKITIIEVPLNAPQNAHIVSEPVLFPDGGNPGDGQSFPFGTRATSGCHDITVFPEKNLAAGACMGDGVLWDISDRTQLRELDRVQDDEFFAFWHSATFNNEGTKVVFTDELGGGGAATCVPGMDPRRGADGIYDIVGEGDARELVFRSYFKIPRMNADSENCVAHNGSLIPVPGKDIMVQSWYMGGISVWDFTDSSNPKELGYWERGPVPAGDRTGGGTWSAYWYNGHVYSSDLGKGFDVLKVSGPEFAKAQGVKFDELNVQTQPVYAGMGRP
jgi:hypothetical protein